MVLLCLETWIFVLRSWPSALHSDHWKMWSNIMVRAGHRLSGSKLPDKALRVITLSFSSSLPATAFHCFVPYILLLLRSLKCPPRHGGGCSECWWVSLEGWAAFCWFGALPESSPASPWLAQERGVWAKGGFPPLASGTLAQALRGSWLSLVCLSLWSTRGKVTLSVV